MELFIWALNSKIKKLDKHNIRLNIIGDVSEFSSRIQDKINQAHELTRKNDGMVLNIAANYSGQWDIIQGVIRIAEQIQDGLLFPHQITEEHFSRYLCTYSLAPVDLLIRTGGEHRISNFLLWQIAYAEFYFTDILWPDFDEYIFEKALEAFALRNRRYGNLKLDNCDDNQGRI
jgi:undecaprenyl diphosphate synthase